MSNMSYCRFRNTVQDLRDCMEALEDVKYNNEKLSRKEQTAMEELIEYACEIAEDYGRKEND